MLGLRLGVLAGIALMLMTVDQRTPFAEPLRAAFAVALYPLQLAVHAPTAASLWIGEMFKARTTLQHDNRALRGEQMRLQTSLARLESLQAENARLKRLLHAATHPGIHTQMARLLAVDLDANRHQFLIDKGGRDGVYLGQPLMDSHGLLGQVLLVNPMTANVLLLTDPRHALPVQVNRNGLRTLAVGIGRPDRLELPYLPNNADIRVGDLLVSSGIGGRFPADYPVAQVTHVEFDPGKPFAEVAARPAAQLDRGREVLLLRIAPTP